MEVLCCPVILDVLLTRPVTGYTKPAIPPFDMLDFTDTDVMISHPIKAIMHYFSNLTLALLVAWAPRCEPLIEYQILLLREFPSYAAVSVVIKVQEAGILS